MENLLSGSALEEELIIGWVRLTGVLKNTRITKGMVYNEAIVMLFLYHKYREDGVGCVPFKEIVEKTGMLKSLCNRSVASLEKKGFVVRSEGKDKRTTYVCPVEEKLPAYLEVHARSVALARRIVDLIGTEDANAFVRIAGKVASSVRP